MSVRLINLDRSPQRLHDFSRLNGHMPNIVRFPAIDGKTLDRNVLAARGIMEAGLRYTDGAVGVALSHIALWDEVIESGEIGTVCEDDAIFNENFIAESDAVIKSLPEDWHFILWGWNFDAHIMVELIHNVSPALVYFNQDTMRQGIAEFQTAKISPKPLKMLRSFGLVCYSISPLGARLFREICVPMREMTVFFPGLNRSLRNNGIDIIMNEAYPRMNAFLSFPPLVITRNDHSISTVQTG